MANSSLSLIKTSSQKPSFASFNPRIPTRQAIALISVDRDPSLDQGQTSANRQTVYVRQVGESLAKLGWQVDIFTRKTQADLPRIVQHSPHCRTIRLGAGPQEPLPRETIFDYLPDFIESFQKFQAKDGFNYPLVHTNYWLSGWVGLKLQELSNIQLLHTVHSLGINKFKSQDFLSEFNRIRLIIEKSILDQADRIVATSPEEQEQLRSLLGGDSKIKGIPCGTNTENFHLIPKPEARLKLNLNPQEKILLYVGRFDPIKGIDTLIQAFHLLKTQLAKSAHPCRLVLVGDSDPEGLDGLEKARIQQLVTDLGLTDSIVFAGHIQRELLPFYYAAADVCAIPSHYEPFGLVAIEAMACGTPVVASNVGGLKFTIVPEETGLLVSPKNDLAFAEAIARILSDRPWAHSLQKQASARVQENFSWTSVAAQLSHAYRQLLAQSLMHPLPPTAAKAIATPVLKVS